MSSIACYISATNARFRLGTSLTNGVPSELGVKAIGAGSFILIELNVTGEQRIY